MHRQCIVILHYQVRLPATTGSVKNSSSKSDNGKKLESDSVINLTPIVKVKSNEVLINHANDLVHMMTSLVHINILMSHNLWNGDMLMSHICNFEMQ